MLDLTRLMRRAGRVLTGVDRVELAYARALLDAHEPVFALIRSRVGYILLDEGGLRALLPQIVDPSGNMDVWKAARRAACGRVVPPLLGLMLRKAGLGGCAYVNVGHSNLTHRVLRTLKGLQATVTVMIHDVIPLDFPDLQRDGVAAKFSAMLGRVERYADLIIYNSTDTQTRTEAHLKTKPASIVANLGTDPASAAPGLTLPEQPYFICVGTIEPRKNHAFLLDLWDDMGADAPHLIIAGNRGWKNEAVFERLDGLPPGGAISEINGLTDSEIAALIKGANGLLFPSLAEGYGLPAIEAAALGTPMILNDLPVYREVLGDIPIYASVSDRYLWINKIKTLVEPVLDEENQTQFAPPTWAVHFKTVLRLT